MSFLQEEKVNILQENKKLQERLQEIDSPLNSSLVAGSKYSTLKKEYDTLKEELFRVETMRDDFRMRAEAQERDLLELQAKVEELQIHADEARHLKVPCNLQSFLLKFKRMLLKTKYLSFFGTIKKKK